MDEPSNNGSKPGTPPLTRWEQVQLTVVWFLVAGIFATFITLALQAK